MNPLPLMRLPRRYADALRNLAMVAAFVVCGLPAASIAMPVTYYESVFNTTASAGITMGLGNEVFGIADPTSTDAVPYTYITMSFTGDTDDTYTYQIGTSMFYRIDNGSATLRIRDVTHDITRDANFDPGEIYVSSDVGRGIGFGSRIYPIYPYGLLINSNVFPAEGIDLAHDLDYFYYAISCVGFASGPCQNFAPNGANFPLHTDQGDFWITGQGITSAAFSVITTPTSVPEPASLALFGAAFAAATAIRRRSRSR